MDTKQEFAKAWQGEMVPLLNGVTYPDGRWFKMSPVNDKLEVREMRWDIRDMEDEWTYFTELCRESVPGSSLEIAAGEGGLGTDGVVTLVDSRNNSVLWVLFLDWSNPFDRLEVTDKRIIAKTTLDTLWTIDMQTPENAAVLSVTN